MVALCWPSVSVLTTWLTRKTVRVNGRGRNSNLCKVWSTNGDGILC
jgi:hypothetical protein